MADKCGAVIAWSHGIDIVCQMDVDDGGKACYHHSKYFEKGADGARLSSPCLYDREQPPREFSRGIHRPHIKSITSSRYGHTIEYPMIHKEVMSI